MLKLDILTLKRHISSDSVHFEPLSVKMCQKGLISACASEK